MTSPHTDTKLLLIATVTLPDGYTYEAAGRILDLYNSSNPGAYITTEDYVEFSLANHDNNGASDYHWEVSDGIVYLQGYDNTLIEFSGQRNIYTIVCYYKNRCGKKVTISATVSPRKAIW